MLIAIVAVIAGIGSATPFAVIGGIAMFFVFLCYTEDEPSMPEKPDEKPQEKKDDSN
jgi:hypothetical protein